MISAKFNTDLGFLDSKFIGEVNLQEIVDYIVATKNNQSYPRVLKILTDATKAEMGFSGESLSTIVEENNKSLEKYDAIIDAIVIDSPRETALSQLYQELSKTKKYTFSVFSTREAALEWLESSGLPPT